LRFGRLSRRASLRQDRSTDGRLAGGARAGGAAPHRAHPPLCPSASPPARAWIRQATPSAAIRDRRDFPEEAVSD
jgi:hypothetical protein